MFRNISPEVKSSWWSQWFDYLLSMIEIEAVCYCEWKCPFYQIYVEGRPYAHCSFADSLQ